MNMKNAVAYIAMGVGGTLLYQQMRNGNVKKCLNDMKKLTKRAYDDLEDMI